MDRKGIAPAILGVIIALIVSGSVGTFYFVVLPVLQNVVPAGNVVVPGAPVAACGNGFVEAGEECDDGNRDEGDRCSSDCKLTYCKDMVVQRPNGRGEGGGYDSERLTIKNGGSATVWGIQITLKDAQFLGANILSATFEAGGSAVTVAIGKTADGGGARIELRGGAKMAGDEYAADITVYDLNSKGYEECDAKNGTSVDRALGERQCAERTNSTMYACDAEKCKCVPKQCVVDGLKQLWEQCDDGNANNNDACDNNCMITYCGDAKVQTPNGKGLGGLPPGFNEQCDDRAPNADAVCQGLLGDPTAKCKNCLCVPGKKQWFSCAAESVAWTMGVPTAWAPGVLCADDCAAISPDYKCDLDDCLCVRDVSCSFNTLVSNLPFPIGMAPFNPALDVCKDDCPADEVCDAATCLCEKKPKTNVSCDENTGSFMGQALFDPATDVCIDDCPPDEECVADPCKCVEKNPPKTYRCWGNGWTIGQNEYQLFRDVCIDDCPNWWYCDWLSCMCELTDVEYCWDNTMKVDRTDKNDYNTADVCIDNCPVGYKCYGSSCTCGPDSVEKHKVCNSEKKCVEVEGAGEDECVDDSWCGRVVTPRCGDTYLSSPDKPGGGDEECEPSTTPPVLCPTGKICHYCKCVGSCPEYTYANPQCDGMCKDNEKCVIAATYLNDAPQSQCYKCVASCPSDEYPAADCNGKCGSREKCGPGRQEGCYRCRTLTGCAEDQYYTSNCDGACRPPQECGIVNINVPCYDCVSEGCPSDQYEDQGDCEEECAGDCRVDESTGCFYCHGTVCEEMGMYVDSDCEGKCAEGKQCVRHESGCYRCQTPPCPDLWVNSLSASIHVSKSTQCQQQGEMQVCTTTCILTSTSDVVVKNIGSGAAGSSSTSVVTKSGATELASDTLGTQALDPGESSGTLHSEKTYQRIVSGTECPAEFGGPFQVKARADAGSAVAECNENNNEVSVSPSVGG